MSDITFGSGRLAALLVILLVAGHLGYELGSDRAPIRTWLRRYHANWHHDLTLLHTMRPARDIVTLQVGLAAASLSLLILGQWALAVLALAAIFLPNLWLVRERRKRTERLDLQLDLWLTALTNALQATPALGDAIASTAKLVDPPMANEVELITKENQLGMPLDDALERAAVRSGSRVFRSVITTLKVARNTGGNLPTTLQTAAESLREMARLEGVVRTKTAEGKVQTVVLGLLPAGLYYLLISMRPDHFDPMDKATIGTIMYVMCGILWVGAIAAAHKILAVDI
jgi:tight adherence protein B